MKRVSDQLREIIERSGLSRYEIARRTGIHQSQLCRFASGERGLSMAGLDALGKLLGLKVTATRRPTRGGR